MTDRWSNWAGDQTCAPAARVRPGDPEEVSAAVKMATQRDWTVRVAGAGHSFTDAVLTDGMLLSLERMDRVLEIDREAGLVKVESGITLRALNEVLAANGLALPNMGDVDVQSIAGATATGTHGTGRLLPNLSAALRSIQLVLADGSLWEVDDRDPETLRAARVAVGSLGVVTSVTVQTVPAFALRGVDAPRPIEEVLDEMDDLVDSNDHFEFFAFPHSPLALTRTNNRVDEPPRPRSKTGAWTSDILVGNHTFGAFCRLGRRFPPAIPTINRLVSRLAGQRTRVDRSDRIFASPRLVRFTEMEYAVPRSHAAEAVRAVRSLSEESRFHVSFPLEVRFVAPDDAFLSPAQGRETCYIAVHTFQGMEWEPYFRAVEEIMDGFDGRPHWGKRHFQTAETLRKRYPEWDRFAAVRTRLDPNGRFANEYVRKVLGGS